MQGVLAKRPVSTTKYLSTVIAALAVCAAGVLSAPVSALGAAFPFADNNNNGVFDADVDVDISAELQAGSFATSESIVLPDGMKRVVTKDGVGLSVSAGKDITVGGDVNVIGPWATVSLQAGGSLVVLDKTRLKADFAVQLSAAGDVVVGKGSALLATDKDWSMVSVEAGGGVSVGTNARLEAHDRIDVLAQGDVTFGDNVRLLTHGGDVNIAAGGNAYLDGSQLAAWYTGVSANEMIMFKGGRVTAPKSGGMVLMYTAGSHIDVSQARWTNLGADDVMLLGEEVIH
jgi:hypothetical protein